MNKRLLKQKIKSRLSIKETIDMSNAGREDERLQDLLISIPHYAKNWKEMPVFSKDLSYFVEDLQAYMPGYNAQASYDRMINAYNTWLREQIYFDSLLTKIAKQIRQNS